MNRKIDITDNFHKGIFWCCKGNDDTGNETYQIYRAISVLCDSDGNALEGHLPYSSKHGDNYNHKVEWEKFKDKRPYNYFPRGRIEIKNGRVRIYASPCIASCEKYRRAVCDYFKYDYNNKDIRWIADNSWHYQYVTDEID